MQISLIRVIWILVIGIQSVFAGVSDYKVSMTLSDDTIHLGESVTLELKFFYKDLYDYEVPTPHIESCSIEEISDKEKKISDGYEDTIRYKLRPKQAGVLTIASQKVQVDIKVNGKKERVDLYTDPLQLKVNALPKDISLVGHYTLKVWTDATSSRRDTPTILHIMIEGEGNLENLDAINIEIPHSTIFSSTKHKANHYEKIFKILANEDFTIPALSLSFWDSQNKEVVIRKSNEIPIKIVDKITKGLSMQEKIIYFVSGAIMMLLIPMLYNKLSFLLDKREEHSWIAKLKKTKETSQLLKIAVVMLGKDKKLDKLIYRLESSKEAEFKRLKKEIIARASTLLCVISTHLEYY